MAAFMMIVMSMMFPMSNAYSDTVADGVPMYTLHIYDPQRKANIRCDLLKLKGKDAIVCLDEVSGFKNTSKTLYTTYMIDIQRNTKARCDLLVLKGRHAIVCLDVPIKEIKTKSN